MIAANLSARMASLRLARLGLASFGLATLATIALVTPSNAQTIYPIDRAEILAGSRFDLKVEFPGELERGDIKVFINGEDAATVLGTTAQVIDKEDGGPLTAYWLRGVAIEKPGAYMVEARTANGAVSSKVTWEVFDTPKGRIARNVILFIGDGMSMAHRNAARMLSKGIAGGRYGGELAIDDMPNMALVSTAGSDSIITDSANSMSAYTTGHKTCVNAMGVYCSTLRTSKSHPMVENLTELAKRRHGLAVGIVTNTEIQDATPAAMVAHLRERRNYEDVVVAYHKAQPEVMLGGGWPTFLPATHPEGKRSDNEDYITKFISAGYTYVRTASILGIEAERADTRKLLGLFNPRDIDGALDRKFLKKGTVGRYPDQPDLTEQVSAALKVLSRNDNGFVLMVESGRIDKYSHSLDWERAVYDTIMLDNAVKLAKDWAAAKNDTLIVVVGDHTHPVAIIGTYEDAPDGSTAAINPRDRLKLYEAAKFPNYPAPDAEGYPSTVDVTRRLAFVFAAYPDHCDAGRPYLGGENKPATVDPEKRAVANEDNCQAPGVARRLGNLPLLADRGIHSGDDVVLTAMGPGAEQFRGRIDNTRVFRAIATALGLAGAK
jgi:alkaline phosphatase